MGEPSVIRINRLDLAFAPKPWDFANEHRAEIDAYFAGLQREKPAIWNGRVLLLHSHVARGDVFHGQYLETDYASFAAWRHWGRPRAGVCDCFGAAAVLSADGAFLLGVMGAHTANAGSIYFPCGTPDRNDILDGKIDLDVSVRRELMEEAGLDVATFMHDHGWTSVIDGSLIAQIKVVRSPDDAETLRARMLAHMAREEQPELGDIRIVRGPEDFDAAMPRFIMAFLAHRFGIA